MKVSPAPVPLSRSLVRNTNANTLNAEVGTRLGRLLTSVLRESHADVATQQLLVEDFIYNENPALSSVCGTNPNILALITTFATNKSFHSGIKAESFSNFLRKGQSVDDKTSSTIAADVARDFAFLMLTSSTPEIALDEWYTKHHAFLEPLFSAHTWLKPFLLQLSSLLLNELSKWRIWPSALIAFFDHFSDVYMTVYYLQNDKQSVALGLLAILVV